MRLSISKNKKYIFYFLYSLILLIVLLYFRFPSNAFKFYLQATAKSISPENILMIREVKPAFPVGINLADVRFSSNANPDIRYLSADSITVRPQIWSFLLGRLKFNFMCNVNKGFLEGNIHFTENKTGSHFKSSIKFNSIKIAEASSLSSFIECDLNGELDGSLTFSSMDEKLQNGAGEAQFNIKNGRITFFRPIPILGSIDFEDLKVRCVMEKRNLRLNHFELLGQEMTGTLSGEIRLNNDISKSAVNIRGSIELSPAFFKNRKDSSAFFAYFRQRMKNGRLSFLLTGNISEPRFTLL
ncbi:MAG TPA: type II secretion system protein GspN [Desulfobacteraceae bacterium]|nr:type II secretion system protein GspN [Desulfobacteraceae bacterium]HPJ66897.1 type II secretion system protein GspN [Desulfobacteraceae bacterium]HPQ27644.1 type II secretion system protein GspN [Desulfobacteraceae bacterium]